jgi:hypothetical protein
MGAGLKIPGMKIRHGKSDGTGRGGATEAIGRTVWEEPRVGCWVQGAATAAWLVVFAVARLLLESHL